jgi:hypothetical protein
MFDGLLLIGFLVTIQVYEKLFESLYSQIQLNLSIAMHAGMPLELPAQQK